jgi:hypothetical protein
MAWVYAKHGGEDINAKRTKKENTAAYAFGIAGAVNDVDALLAMDSYKADFVTIGGVTLAFDSIKLKHVEAETYEATVEYVHPESQKNEEEQNNDAPQITFDSTGSTQHITHSFETLRAYPPSVGKDMNKQAIGVEKTMKGDMKIHGTDVIVPALKCTISAKINQPSNPFEYARRMARQVGKINKEGWNGFEKSELLFLGGSISGKKREKWTVELQFDCDEGITVADNFKIGEFGPIEKEGHAHLWVQWAVGQAYVPGEGETGPIIPKPVAVFIEKIYRDFSMGDLGL